ncbi:MAG: RES domain-containing protein ['Candidatus Kapabacteria' thiocyanatum]|uniref:RES domain-containing protein n=1 Tax=Candidatus Kapaibacterium thiocyanatum TaxID=1895771 RepID=A0A1M3L214_9BACT|nr:RES domain-containing protein ['Candidatus Kapabacteria' thiocyanatum]OJX59284.1 MAG: hypothetical protein BGO89_02380 ['Candidatus Kapabacteria' thiocyanatum]
MAAETRSFWRIVKHRYAAHAMDGEGARLYGGRWNLRDTTAVYLSESLSLAALELFVHLAPEDSRLRFVAIEVVVPADVAVETVGIGELPDDWTSEPPLEGTQRIGTEWCESMRTAFLRIPSAIVPGEWNVLLNPRHPDWQRCATGKPVAFGFDGRMWKK